MATYLPGNVVSDPDSLSAIVSTTSSPATPGAGDEVFIDTVNKKIQLRVTGALTIHGVTLKCLYSFLKEEWKENANLIQFPFPMTPITDEQFEFFNGWNLDNANTTGSENQNSAQLVRTGGWAVKKYDSGSDTNGNDIERWASVITLGALGDETTSTDQVYYLQENSESSANTFNFKLTGPVNQAVQFYRDDAGDGVGTSPDYNYSQFLKLFCREWGKTYASSAAGSLASATGGDIGVTTLTYQAYRFPLTNAADAKITALGVSEANANGAISPYNNMNIKWYNLGQEKTGFFSPSTAYFKVIIDGDVSNSVDNPSKEQIYAFTQAKLRNTVNINSSTGTGEEDATVKIGKVVSEKLRFIGDDLYTLGQTANNEGVFIDDTKTSDVNNFRFWGYSANTGGTEYREIRYPFTAVLTLNFGENLQNDNNAIYKVFFTNNLAGSANGYNFGTANAIIVKDSSGNNMTGFANTSSVQLTYAYDTNNQRGGFSAGNNAPITVVAIGLGTAQYVKTTGTIERTTTNTLSLVAPLERNYANP